MNPKPCLQVFLVDDEAPARARLRTILGDIASDMPHQVVGEAENGIEALPQILRLKPDLVLLDVQMPGMDGIELAGHLVRQTSAAALIFVTAFDEYALKAFEVHALDYLLKPVRASRLMQALERVQHQVQQKMGNTLPAVVKTGAEAPQAATVMATLATSLHLQRQHFSVQERGRLLLVPVSSVLYLRAEQKYVTLRSNEREFLIEDSLVSIEEELSDTFVRVHRNALVARAAIAGVERGVAENGDKSQESWQVIVRDVAERLPISRRQWPIIKALVR
jgi:two-component system, LytTR family, response regulator AlgR